MFRLDDRVAVITGAASGIGAATAEVFARAGADSVLAWYPGDDHDIAPVVAAVEAAGRRAVAVETDVGQTEDVDRLVAAAIGEFGRLDIVVANAGIARDVPSTELDDDEWRRLMEIDLLGVFRCFRAALPPMIEAGWGRLIATSSISGAVISWPRHVHYTAAKGGVLGLVRGLAIEVAHQGITVNAVAPGVIVTPQSTDPVHSFGAEGVHDFASRVPVGRNGQPEDVAAAFTYLASEEAAFMTGQTLILDGGYTVSHV
ncbi:MAG: 3-oxoacyl-[acyl-carrier protein] reductase [Solirubrobacteraceae bacterium]|jgi:3-oxoacyl-[acyl-carrier protein] reductase|nr:3-oxoacyl-[acyl-carrier protein] reductase [Solirubrobacteraceae bacterium]